MCDHEHVVEDQHEGTRVCTDCSHVIDSQIYFDGRVKHSLQYLFNTGGARSYLNETVMDLIARLHLEGNAVIVQGVCDKFLTLLNKCPTCVATRRSIKKCDELMYSPHMRTHLAYAIYATLIYHSCARTPSAVAALCDVDAGAMLKTDRLDGAPCNAPLHSYTASVLGFFPFGENVNLVVHQLVELVEGQFSGCRPESIITACLCSALDKMVGHHADVLMRYGQEGLELSTAEKRKLTICRRERDQMNEWFPLNFKQRLVKMADTLGVTARSVERIMHGLPQYEVNSSAMLPRGRSDLFISTKLYDDVRSPFTYPRM